jgi:ElaB/YqjD/DUF883 family membrane-anchored ribosome-binding protein
MYTNAANKNDQTMALVGPGSDSEVTHNEKDLSELAQDYGQKLVDVADKAKAYVSEKATVFGEKLKNLQDADLNELATDAKDYARKNPGKVMLFSAAAGLVFGLLLRGSRR